MRLNPTRWLLLAVIVSACAAAPIPIAPPSPTAIRPTVTPAITVAPPPTPTPSVPPPTATLAPTASEPVAPAPIVPDSNAAISLDLIVSGGLVRPADLTHAGDERLFVVEQPGRIRIIKDGQLLDRAFLDLTDRVSSAGNERGLLGLAFHPNYAANGQFFVNYTRQPDGATIIARFTVSAADPDLADKDSAAEILRIDQPEANHNGGQLALGPDGYLYVGTGDGGGGGDRHGSIGNGQDLNSLLGKLLRLDVNAVDTYTLPPDNPFGDEIWAYGLRNPWRFSFDRATGDLWIADVGQNAYEEINYQPADSAGGQNYGWRIMEATHCFNPQTGCDQNGLVLPVAEYSHAAGCSVTGGYVYRGAQFPQLTGQYFFADYCVGTIWSLTPDANGGWAQADRLATSRRVSSFGQDVHGELYVIDHAGAIFQLVAR